MYIPDCSYVKKKGGGGEKWDKHVLPYMKNSHYEPNNTKCRAGATGSYNHDSALATSVRCTDMLSLKH